MNQFKDLDPMLHSQLRLAIISLLMREKESDFSVFKRQDKSHCRKSECTNKQIAGSRIY